MRSFAFEGVVLVADVVDATSAEIEAAQRRDLDQTELTTLEELRSTILDLGLRVHHYLSPADLAASAARHKADVVLSIYGGMSSRSRMAVTPAVCEAFGLRYIGPDAYGRIVAQDKEISKRLAADYGLTTPAWRVVRSAAELPALAALSPPLVVKPALEGSSIGISSRNLLFSVERAIKFAAELLAEFDQPVIAERFVAGREVSYVKIESASDNLWAFSEVFIADQQSYFETHLFDADEKLSRQPCRSVRNIDAELDSDDKAAFDRFLRAFGPFGYCRIDGRLKDGKFHFIELTPDAWLGKQGQFAGGFTEKGWTYADVIAAILASADSNPRARSSSG